jgi:sterol desaturase/sphingolipid hydroxylase (fatty acid hydroxylase superfamily)
MEQYLALIQSKAGIIAGFAIAVFAIERIFPAVRPLAAAHLASLRERTMRLLKNVSLAAVNAILSPLVVVPLSALAAGWAFPWRPSWWSGGAGLVLDLVILDLWIYWWHRANHRIPLLWRFHEVHHLDEFLDVTTAVRFHFGEVLLSSVARAIVIFLLAVPLANVVIFETLLIIATIFHHSNLKLPPVIERALAKAVVTPSIHWVHHHAIRTDTDSNYATILSLWDPLFRSRSATRRTPEMRIGVEARSDEVLAQLVVRPFLAIERYPPPAASRPPGIKSKGGSPP